MTCAPVADPCEHCLTMFTRMNRWLIKLSEQLQATQMAVVKLRADQDRVGYAFLDLARHMGYDVNVEKSTPDQRVLKLRLTDNMVVHPADIEDEFVAHLMNRACVCVRGAD